MAKKKINKELFEAVERVGICESVNLSKAEELKALIKSFIDTGANVNEKNKEGDPLLCKCESAEVTQMLLNAGADVNANNEYGSTPLHKAVASLALHRFEITKLLIDAGADVNAKNNDGNTPLFACHDDTIAKLLIDSDADVNTKNNNGNTPLHLCTNNDVVKLLIDAGADVNAKNNDGSTPLHWNAKRAVNYRNVDIIIKSLIDAGADVNTKDNNGKTPLDICTDASISKLLTSATANTTSKNKANSDVKDTEKHASFASMTFLFTGKLVHMKREEAEAKVAALGGKAVSGVSKTLSVLVATSDTSAKWTKAQELNSKGANIQLWTEEQFMAELEKAEATKEDKGDPIDIETLDYTIPEGLNTDAVDGYKNAYLVIIHAFVNDGWTYDPSKEYDPSSDNYNLTKTSDGIRFSVSISDAESVENGSVEVWVNLENDNYDEQTQLHIAFCDEETDQLLPLNEVFKNANETISDINHWLVEDFIENSKCNEDER